MYVNVVFVMSGLYSAVSLTPVRGYRLIFVIILYKVSCMCVAGTSASHVPHPLSTDRAKHRSKFDS